MVERSSNVGKKKDKEKEKADESEAVEMLFEVLKGKDIDDKDGDEYNFGGAGEDNDEVSIVSTCMGDCSCARTSTAVDNNEPAGDDDAGGEQTDETRKD